MVVAYGAESRIGNKYGQFVEEAKKHVRFVSPFIGIQFGLVVCQTELFVFFRNQHHSLTTSLESSSLAAMPLLRWHFGTEPGFCSKTRSTSLEPLLCKSLPHSLQLKEDLCNADRY
jgi:hypothetical protein